MSSVVSRGEGLWTWAQEAEAQRPSEKGASGEVALPRKKIEPCTSLPWAPELRLFTTSPGHTHKETI